MRILLFGRTGQVGSGLYKGLKKIGSVCCVGRDTADLTDLAAVENVIQKERPDVIVNAAAYTHVDHAETDAETANLVNARAPEVMAAMAAANRAWLIHYSTDYVFDGESDRAYTEDQTQHPISVYGRTKAAGEQAIRNSTDRYLILRTSWVYSNMGRNFLNTVLRLAQERPELKIVDDQTGTPTYAGALAANTVELVKKLPDAAGDPEMTGIFNMTCQGSTTWYGFAKAILNTAGIEDVRITPITTSEFPTPAARPRYSVLDNTKLQRVYGVSMPAWRDALRECLAQRAFL